MDPDLKLAGTRQGLGHLVECKSIGAADGVGAKGFHGGWPSRAASCGTASKMNKLSL